MNECVIVLSMTSDRAEAVERCWSILRVFGLMLRTRLALFSDSGHDQTDMRLLSLVFCVPEELAFLVSLLSP